jgi:eukaryotic-like serine/threonine-protein kinase
VSAVCADLPSCLDAPVLQMLEKKPEDRPESASAALAGLEQALRSTGHEIPPGLPHLSPPAAESAAVSNDGESAWGATLGHAETERFSASISPPPKRRRWPWFAAAALLVLAALSLGRSPASSTSGAGAELPPPGNNAAGAVAAGNRTAAAPISAASEGARPELTPAAPSLMASNTDVPSTAPSAAANGTTAASGALPNSAVPVVRGANGEGAASGKRPPRPPASALPSSSPPPEAIPKDLESPF